MKKSIVVVLAVIMLVSLVAFTGCAKSEVASDNGNASEDVAVNKVTIGMLPQFKGENYFDACKKGAEEAVEDLIAAGVEVKFLYDGPLQSDATNEKQVDILQGWIAQDVDVLIVSPLDMDAIVPTLNDATEKGIKVLTYDADAQPDARELFINQATAAGLGKANVEIIANQLIENGWGPDGTRGETVNMAILSQFETDANLSAWRDAVVDYTTENYPWITINPNDIIYGGASETDVQNAADIIISRMGEGADNLQAAIGITSVAAPALGAAFDKAVLPVGSDVLALTGIATPVGLKDYILDEANPLNAGVLWNCMDLGYLSVMAGYQLYTGDASSTSTSITTERLGEKSVNNKQVILGDCLIFDKDNIDQYNY